MIDGASVGFSETAFSCATCSRDGTVVPSRPATASQATMISQANRRMMRAAKGCGFGSW